MKPDTFIVIEIQLPFKCKFEEFEKIYQNEYKGKISHKLIRSVLDLPDSVRLKFNGTFQRWLYLLDENDCLYKVRYIIQTALWFNEETGKWQYVSVFPSFIKRWYRPSLNLLEYVSCKVRKGEDILIHIDDPEELLSCEDCIAGAISRVEKHCIKINCEAMLNSRYTEVFNRPVPVKGFMATSNKRFSTMYSLVTVARHFFGINNGVLALVNTIIRL